MTALVTIPARHGKAAVAKKGQKIRLINTHGYQIVDTWAFNEHDMKEFMSMEHCRVALNSLRPKVGQSLVTNKRRPIVTLVEDTTPGVHDMLVAACDRYRYELLGCKEYHDNCTDNLVAGLKELGLEPPRNTVPIQHIPEHAAASGFIRDAIPAVRGKAWSACNPARRHGSGDRVFCLSSRHGSRQRTQWRQTGGSTFSDALSGAQSGACPVAIDLAPGIDPASPALPSSHASAARGALLCAQWPALVAAALPVRLVANMAEKFDHGMCSQIRGDSRTDVQLRIYLHQIKADDTGALGDGF